MKSRGTIIKIGANAVANVNSINDVGVSAETFESGSLSSEWEEFEGSGVSDAGEVAISGLFDPSDTTGQKAMYDAVISGVKTAFSILFPGATTDYTFTGIVTNFKVGMAKKEGITFDATIRTSGASALNITASAGLSALSLTGTGGTLSPAFGAGIRSYTFIGVTANSVTVTPTAASHTIKLYVDGTYSQDITSGSPSAAIPLSIGSKKLTLIANEVGKAQQVTEIIVVKPS